MIKGQNWNEHYEQLKRRYEDYGTSYVPISFVSDNGFRLGYWASRQRHNYRNGNLSEKQKNLLNKIAFDWDVSYASKNTSIPELLIFFNVKKYFPDTIKLLQGDCYSEEIDVFIPSLKIGIEYDGIYWHKDKLKQDETKGKRLSKYGIKLIRFREKGLPAIKNCSKNIFVDPKNLNELERCIEALLCGLLNCQINYSCIKDDYKKIVLRKSEFINYRWDYIYSILKERFEKTGRINIKKGEYDTSGIDLYNWIKTQRSKYQKGLLSEQRVKLLTSLKISLSPYEENWNCSYKELVEYLKSNNNANVPINYITNNGTPLGKWVAQQRERYRAGKLNIERKRLLLDIGFDFNPSKTDEEYKMELLTKYYYENGNINTCRDLYFGVNLFEWLQGKKKKYSKGKLSNKEIDFFNSLGIKWNIYEDSWDNYFQLAKEYYMEFGNLLIPTNYTLYPSINLGIWISTRRNDYKQKKLSSERIKKLNEIGMIWNAYDYNWQMKYNVLLQYYKEFGNINLKCTAEYKNVKLGMWLNTQRQAYRGNPNYHITQKRIDLLNALNMRW